MNWVRGSIGILGCALVAACGTPKVPATPTNAAGTWFKGGIIPATSIALTPTTIIPLEKLVYWSGVAALAYYVVDPMSPNWEIEEAKFPDDHYKLSLKMKRYYSGGAGESRVVFNHRAKALADANGYSNYRILEYSEGLESNAIGSQRTAEGVIVLTGKVAPPPKTEAPKVSDADTATAVPVPTFKAPPALPPTLALAETPAQPAAQEKGKPKVKRKKRKDDCK